MTHPAPAVVHLVPIAEIDAEALTRDRTATDADALAELQASILAHGLRQPVEVYALPEPVPTRDGPTLLYGLISGHRRLTAVRALHALTGSDRFAAIPAFLRAPASLEAALLAMVEENEVRADLSPWERGLVLVNAVQQEVFATLDEAVDKLHPAANRAKRLRLRQLAFLVEELDGHLHAPETLSQRNALRLAEACRRGFGDLLRPALASTESHEAAAQWNLVAPILLESEETRAEVSTTPGRPRRVSTPRHGLVIRRERTRSGYSLHFTGRGAMSMLMDSVFDEIDRLFSAG